MKKQHSIFKKIAILLGAFAGLLGIVAKRKEIKKDVIATRKALSKKLDTVEKAIPKKYSFGRRAVHTLKDYLVPHQGNNHHPKALRPKALTAYVVTILVVKVVVTAALFFLYPNTGYVSSKISDDLYALTNQTRLEAGLEQLEVNPALVAAAQAKVQDMIDQGYFAHISPDGTKPWEFIDRTQYDFSHMGENLAMDFSSAKVVHSAFLNSPTHRDNIMHDTYTDIGIAVLVGELYGRETIVLAEYFGTQSVTDTLAIANNNTPEATQAPTQVQPAVEETKVPEVETTLPVSDESVEATPVVPEETEVTDTEEVATENEDSVAHDSEIVVVSTTDIVANETSTTSTSTLAAAVEGISYYPGAQIVVTQQHDVEKGLVDLLVTWSRNFMTLMLIIISMLLAVNVVVHYRVQHSHVIAHSLLVIFFILTMIFTRLHFLENFIVY